jgi:hypothetical protein
MPLLDPSIGDLIDRLSILRLKIQHGEEVGKSIYHFDTERAAILKRLNGVNLSTPEVEKLFVANEAIWELTDALRTAGSSDAFAARLGRKILAMNDERARLIAAISAAHGDLRVEKL